VSAYEARNIEDVISAQAKHLENSRIGVLQLLELHESV